MSYLSDEVEYLERQLEEFKSGQIGRENKELNALVFKLRDELAEKDKEIRKLKLNVAELGLTIGRLYAGKNEGE